MNELELKEKLQSLSQNDFHLSPQDDLPELIGSMLKCLGTIDSVLRDDLIYSAFNLWILRDEVLDPTQLHVLARKAISDKHIFHHIGEVEGDGVFTRTFSMLILPLLLISHRKRPYLSPADVDQIRISLLRYGREEKDYRGYVEGKGWAHAVAHYADALDDLAQCAELNASNLSEILAVITPFICRQSEPYGCGEEERMTTAVLSVMRRGLLSNAELAQWINSFGDAVRAVNTHPAKLILRSNVKDFLQSLYFRLRWESPEHALLNTIEQLLMSINPYHITRE